MDDKIKEDLKKSEVYKFKLENEDVTVFVYGHSPKHLNVTGLKSLDHIEYVVRKIERKFDINCCDVKIDNIFISHKDNKNINLTKVYNHIHKNYYHIFHIDYNVELFPGMFLKPKKYGWPTVILFRTGSFQIMGGKKIQSIKEAYTLVKNVMGYFSII